MPVVLLLALLIFGSLVAASMPALVGLLAMVGALAVVRVITTFTEVSVFSVNVISLLGIGLAIDYALFVISRFREELGAAAGRRPGRRRDGDPRTMATAGRTVLFSGLTVAAAMSSLLIFPQAFLRSMGYGGMAAVLVAMLAALTVLPATLRLLGRRVDAGRLPWRRHRPVVGRRRARPLGRPGPRRDAPPWLVIVGTVAVLLLLASPFLGANWGSVDYRVLPPDAPAHVAADKLADFGPETSTAPAAGPGRRPRPTWRRTPSRWRQVDGVTGVAAGRHRGRRHAAARLVGRQQPDRAAARPSSRTCARSSPASGEVLVGGLSADTVDLIDSVGAHLPWMGLIVAGGDAGAAVRRVRLAGAAGQGDRDEPVLDHRVVRRGHLDLQPTATSPACSGFTPQGFLDATNPILMLAILFGLSMDYEVFLLSRIREQWDRTGDNDLAVATGVQKTGRIITSAAVLLAVVIGAFALSGIVFMKMLGIGMLVALLIDATVVRGLLVPATMKLLGRWNWWAPGPDARWWERYGFREGEEATPPPAAREPETAGV